MMNRFSLVLLLVIAAICASAFFNQINFAHTAGASVTGTKTVSSGSKAPSAPITYTITLTNSGADAQGDNGGDEFTDTLPATLTFVSADATSGTASDNGAGTVTWNGSISGSGGSVTITIQAFINSDVPLNTVISNQGTINFDGDYNGSNESSQSTDNPDVGGSSDPTSFTVLSPANISGTKSVSGTFTPGSTITYLVTLKSSLSSSAQFDNPGDEFTDTLPANLTLVSADASAGLATANVPTNTVTWNGMVPGSGDSVSITITATINSGTEGNTVSNQGTINYDADGNGSNDSSRMTDGNTSMSGEQPTVFNVCFATQVVTTNADSGAGSLRQAIADACPGTSVTFSNSVTSPIILTNGEIVVDKDLTITGPTNTSLTISGNDNSRIFNVTGGSVVSISNLTFTNGKASAGGAIFNAGDLTILNSTFTANKAVGVGAEGGAIDSEGSVTGGRLNIVNSTISGNTSDLDGGGILNCGNSIATLTNVTITNNRADANGDDEGSGGGLAQVSGGNLTLNNTIIAGNTRGSEPGTKDDVFVLPDSNPMDENFDGSFIDASSSNNLIGVDTGLGSDISNGSNGNQIGTAASPINPQLRPLANNGGPTQTHMLLLNSPALNTGNSSLALGPTGALTTDQRGSGFPRIVGSSVDIGAAEANYTITATAGTPQSATINTQFSTALQATVKESGINQQGLSVTFTAPVSGPSGSFGSSATVLTDAGGVATAPTFTANGLAGTYNVTATLTGSSLSAVFALTNTAGTTTTVTSSVNPSMLAQSVTFTATVTSAGGTPIGTIQFKDNGTNLGSPVTLNGSGVATFTTSALTVGSHTISADYLGNGTFLPSSGTLANAQVVNNRPLVKFSQTDYPVDEGGKFVTITVTRSGDTAPAVNVDFATPDDSAATSVLPCSTANGVASPRCDFTLALGTLRFGSGETSKTFVVLLGEDSYLEGNETIALTLSNLTGGAGFAQPSDASATVTIVDNDFPDVRTPDAQELFVRQHYHDFLNRVPDDAGLAFWYDNIHKCEDLTRRPPNLSLNDCIEVFRINTSAAFFLSIEFQNTGFYVYRLYKVAFGDISPPAVPVPVRFTNFMRDTQDIRAGVIVGQGNWQAQLDNNKVAFALAFVQREAFLARYPAPTSATAFVDTLNNNAGMVLSDSQRSALIAELSPSPADPERRASVLRQIADNALLQQHEFNRAFVLMQYFGYLRRNPDAAPEPGLNFDGYNFWLNKLNSFNGDYIRAEMVRSFLNSSEYRRRYGP